jgi:hypothetical protein
MEISHLEFTTEIPNINDSELSNNYESEFEGAFKYDNFNYSITGNVEFEIVEKEINGTEYAPDTMECYIEKFTFSSIEIQEMEEERYIHFSPALNQTLLNEIENYITNKFND